MTISNIPKWVWIVAGVVLLLVVLAVCKVNISLGASGFHFTQELVH